MTSNRTLSGSAIALAVLGIAAVATFLLGIVQIFPQQVRESQRIVAKDQAEYAAWAGAEHALLELKRSRGESKRFELSAEQQKDPTRGMPYVLLSQKQAACLMNGCLSYRQLLGSLKNASPVSFSLGNDKSAAHYDLLVWHRFESQVGVVGLLPDFVGRKNVKPLFTPSFSTEDKTIGDIGVDIIESRGSANGAHYTVRLIVDPAKGTVKEVITPSE